MRTSSAKAKGRRPMLWLRERLLATFPQLQPDDVRVTASGTPGPDLQLSPAAQQVFPYAVESKNHQTLQVNAAIKQAERHAAETGMEPCIVATRNRCPVYLLIRSAHLMALTGARVSCRSVPLPKGRAFWTVFNAVRRGRQGLAAGYVAVEAEELLVLLALDIQIPTGVIPSEQVQQPGEGHD